ncbi:uncharacterized protein LOC121803995 [Salvia splendens]|uniref:uncharacterized protein LOC121803995 n=1 Tax=Salvia splendens TaxID=180675 RepID=UPI001C263FA4|nr:uncharacterized protein LOC121803995 [Salvia splendens]
MVRAPETVDARITTLAVELDLRSRIIEAQRMDAKLEEIRIEVRSGESRNFSEEGDNALTFEGRLCMLDNEGLNNKRDIASFVERCLVCQQVKFLHQRPYGKLRPLEIPEWKWEHIAMDSVTGLPRTLRGNTAIWVIIDRLTKSAHFIPILISYGSNKLA